MATPSASTSKSNQPFTIVRTVDESGDIRWATTRTLLDGNVEALWFVYKHGQRRMTGETERFPENRCSGIPKTFSLEVLDQEVRVNIGNEDLSFDPTIGWEFRFGKVPDHYTNLRAMLNKKLEEIGSIKLRCAPRTLGNFLDRPVVEGGTVILPAAGWRQTMVGVWFIIERQLHM
ncbi:hypothetical protein K438DRAFT_1764716 [Mycena galopus ATCC 62051]|nr:hypothetical protein K438DRAFT_1764716 [Mycena galopus ATCC 62051]